VAIKISGTTIIDDNFEVINVADTRSSSYDDLHSTVVVTTNNINFATPVMTCTLGAATTFTTTGGATGKTCMLLLDTSSVPYAPTFPSDINWQNNSEPTWSTYQHWQITFLYVASNDIRASAVGFTGSTPTESISLHGTGNTRSAADDTTTSMPVTADCVFGMRFRSDGNIDKYTNGSAFGQTGYWTYSTSSWNNITPSQTYYIRAQNDNGQLTFAINLSTSDSDTLNTWLPLTSNRQFRYRVAGPRSNVGTLEGLMKIEISSTSNGSNIVATGYYYWETNGTA
jgi:hypothetical protein